MQIADVLKSLTRRWYLTVLTLALTLGGAYAVFVTVPPTYQQTASIVLVPGPASVAEGANPLLYLGGLTYQRDLLLRSLGSGSVRGPLLQEHDGADFSVDPDYATQSPVVLITAVGPTPGETTAMLNAVQAAAQVQLDRVQEQVNAPQDTLSGIVQVGEDTSPSTVNSDRLKLTGLTGAVLGVVGVLLTIFIDVRLVARRRKAAENRRSRHGVELDDPVEPDPVDPDIADHALLPPSAGDSLASASADLTTSPGIVVTAHGRTRRVRHTLDRT
ncbi:hypothetical protein [Xylanimonas ulmi]|uniref:Capsular polysaccharide biosynthesis protein n=1 Tax=Xylanimonas ulmi TaxID=228973 RepID=A0A4Q7M2Y4_9MICO|nr:hypothetical protein [Xylanibacterium ulmi]RZS61854.1 hypothetical protein EV386_2166 [Xylanibacterium ulmi]